MLLGAVACWLAWESKGLLIGEAATPEVQAHIREIITSHPGINRVNELITLHMGPQSILVNLSIDFAAELSKAMTWRRPRRTFNRLIKEAVPEVPPRVHRGGIVVSPSPAEDRLTGRVPHLDVRRAAMASTRRRGPSS